LGDPAPLIQVADAAWPRDAAAEWFTGAGGARLRAALLHPPGPARATVVLSPGRTEPIEKYGEVAERLTSRGFAVLAHDWRGQGLSARLLPDRRLGHAVGHGDFLADYDALLGTFTARLPRPWIAMGHSMGGALTLLALARGEARFAGAILSAPMLGLLTGAVPRPVARVLARVLTGLGLGARPVPGFAATPPPFAANILTHDRVRHDRNETLVQVRPDLALAGPTWSWLRFAFAATSLLATGPGVPGIAIPVTVVAAGVDAQVDNAALKAVTARIAQGRYLEIPGAYHEILQETDAIQAAFWRAFDDLASRVIPGA